MNKRWHVRRAGEADLADWSRLRDALWPEAAGVHEQEIRQSLEQPSSPAAFLVLDDAGLSVGFAEASIRRDHVNGTATSPVGFLEGWYVIPAARGRGAGRALIGAVEAWTREQGCRELASDALLDNTGSHRAHLACGFGETERVVYFRKELD